MRPQTIQWTITNYRCNTTNCSCRYVKYLYPYECETIKLSDPQELQIAIDSNKRDRRHSETMDFMAPQLQRELDPTLSPVVSTTPQPGGLQLISSPTMALPHGSLPPYSGGFIVTGGPGGTHVVASPQLVQMASHVPGIPIVMPSPPIPVSTPSQAPPLSNQSQGSSSEDKDDVQSHASGDGMEPPPAKRPALESPHIIVTSGGSSTTNSNRGAYSIHQTSTGNFIMAHGAAMPTAGTPHLIQVGPRGQIPIVLPPGPVSTVREQHKCPAPPPPLHVNGNKAKSLETGSGAMSLSSHPAGIVVSQQRGPVATPPAHSQRNLLQMAHHPSIPGLIIPQPVHGAALSAAPPQNGEEKRKTEQEKTTSTTVPTTAKIPFANISIQSGQIYIYS